MEGFSLLNKAFDSRVRLGLMSILSVNDWISYKPKTNIKDGVSSFIKWYLNYFK